MRRLPGLAGGRLRDVSALTKDPLARALSALNGGGEETRVAGGAVRDLLLGLSAEDYDLATTARPEEVMRRAGAAGFRIVTPGLAHGTVTLIRDGRTIETTTLREDVETDGRHAKVAFGRDFQADARRRDFTINALSLRADGVVCDPVGGLADLAAGRVRFIGDADDRIREDYLRILRFFRFSARFGAVDAEGLSAAIRHRSTIGRLSGERVRAELLKLIVAPYAGAIVRTMSECGILLQTLGFVWSGRFERAIAIEAARDADPDAFLRLAALAALIPEDSERLRDRLRLANAECRRIASATRILTTLHGIDRPPTTDGLKVLLFSAGREAARDSLLLAHVDSATPPDDPAFTEADRFLAETPEPEPPLTGDDLIARGVAEGPEVGEILRAFRRLWSQAGFPLGRDAVDKLVDLALDAPGRSAS